MREQLLHYIWQQRLFEAIPQQTTDGRPVEVIDVGQLNSDSGPDFFNAKIRIGGVYWAGNVEIHDNASDWYHHGHHNDPAYDNIILHVVANSDIIVHRSDGSPVPQCRLRYPEPIAREYELWCNGKGTIPCRESVGKVPAEYLNSWLGKLAIERLEAKAATIDEYAKNCQGGTEEAFYILLARAFGFHTNSMPFELTAKSLPLKHLERHRGQRLQIEALLFGQAGLIKPLDSYGRQLQAEYGFLQHKFSLVPIDGTLWKWMRMRPRSFPTIRMAQFANLMFCKERLMGQLLQAGNYRQIHEILDISAPEYWNTHYDFGEPCVEDSPKNLGHQSVDSLIVNVVAPFFYYNGKKQDNAQLVTRALEILTGVPAENNSVVRTWREAGITPGNALDTQALLQLTDRYCKNHDCLRCRLAYKMLKSYI